MPNKKIILVALAFYALGSFFPFSSVVGIFSRKSSS